MNVLTAFILFLFVAVPLATLVHELGHAVAARICGAEEIAVSVGSGRRICLFRLNKIAIAIHLIFINGGATAWEAKVDMKGWETAVVSIGGPVANGCAAILLFVLIGSSAPQVFDWALLFNLWLFLVNLLPFRLGKRESDGYIALTAILKRQKENGRDTCN